MKDLLPLPFLPKNDDDILLLVLLVLSSMMGETLPLSSEISRRCWRRRCVAEVDAVEMVDELVMEGAVEVADAELIIPARDPPPPPRPRPLANPPEVPVLEFMLLMAMAMAIAVCQCNTA